MLRARKRPPLLSLLRRRERALHFRAPLSIEEIRDWKRGKKRRAGNSFFFLLSALGLCRRRRRSSLLLLLQQLPQLRRRLIPVTTSNNPAQNTSRGPVPLNLLPEQRRSRRARSKQIEFSIRTPKERKRRQRANPQRFGQVLVRVEVEFYQNKIVGPVAREAEDFLGDPAACVAPFCLVFFWVFFKEFFFRSERERKGIQEASPPLLLLPPRKKETGTAFDSASVSDSPRGSQRNPRTGERG